MIVRQNFVQMFQWLKFLREGERRGEVSAQSAPPLPLCARQSLCQGLTCPVHAHIHWTEEKWGGPDLNKSLFVMCGTCWSLSNTVSVTKPRVR